MDMDDDALAFSKYHPDDPEDATGMVGWILCYLAAKPRTARQAMFLFKAMVRGYEQEGHWIIWAPRSQIRLAPHADQRILLSV